jgi:uncharacterized protein (DUF924 family)
MKNITHTEILSFWFQEIEEKHWFSAEKNFDELIRQRFSEWIRHAAAAELFSWRTTAKGRLAEIIVLDQFPCNAYRNTVQRKRLHKIPWHWHLLRKLLQLVH